MPDERFDAWMRALEQRHLADLRVQEVTRALRALSSVYVERRDALVRGKALETAGKRVAFALFYGPLHYLVGREIIRAVGADAPGIRVVFDLGCGIGAVGAAWASALTGEHASDVRIFGFDRHPWAAAEAGWTYRTFGFEGSARRADVRDVRLAGRPSAVVAAFTLNELGDATRERLLQRLLEAAAGGWRVLVVEPIAKPGGWWAPWAAAFLAAGGREDLWRFAVDLPTLVRTLDRAAGLDHAVLTARSLYVPGDSPDVRKSPVERTSQCRQ